MDSSCGKSQQPYYERTLDECYARETSISELLEKLAERLKPVLCSEPPSQPKGIEKEIRGPSCALDERISALLGRAVENRDKLSLIIQRIQL